MAKKWEPEVTRALVMQYELQPNLYKTTSPNYHNKVQRLKALEHIKEELNNSWHTQFTIEEISKKLNNIRTQFLEVHRSCNKKLLQSGSATDEVQQPTWWLYDQLQFLLPYCKKDKGMSNLMKKTSEVSQTEIPAIENTLETEHLIIDDIMTEGEYLIDDAGLLSPTSSIASSSSSRSSNTKQTENKITKETGNKTLKSVKGKKQDNVISAIIKAVEQIANEKALFPPDVESLCNFIGNELVKFKNQSNLRKCKWEILKVIERCQENEYSD